MFRALARAPLIRLERSSLFSTFQFESLTSRLELRQRYLALAKLHHPDIQKHQSSPTDLEEIQKTFVRLTHEYESRMKVLVGDYGNDDASSAHSSNEVHEPTYDDALRTFFGALDREQSTEIRQGMQAAVAAADGVPAGLDKGGYWAAAMSLGNSSDGPEVLGTGTQSPNSSEGSGTNRRRGRK